MASIQAKSRLSTTTHQWPRNTTIDVSPPTVRALPPFPVSKEFMSCSASSGWQRHRRQPSCILYNARELRIKLSTGNVVDCWYMIPSISLNCYNLTSKSCNSIKNLYLKKKMRQLFDDPFSRWCAACSMYWCIEFVRSDT